MLRRESSFDFPLDELHPATRLEISLANVARKDRDTFEERCRYRDKPLSRLLGGGGDYKRGHGKVNESPGIPRLHSMNTPSRSIASPTRARATVTGR